MNAQKKSGCLRGFTQKLRKNAPQRNGSTAASLDDQSRLMSTNRSVTTITAPPNTE